MMKLEISEASKAAESLTEKFSPVKRKASKMSRATSEENYFKWRLRLSCCPEFFDGQANFEISIDRLSKTWIPKFRSSQRKNLKDSNPKNDQDEEKSGKHKIVQNEYRDVLQVNL